MTKIYLSPSDQTENPYAVGNANEGTVCNEIARLLEIALNRCACFDVLRNTSMSITKGIQESNAWKAQFHICIHTNAYNGTVAGTRMFYGEEGGKGQSMCKSIMQFLAPITPGTSDNITQRTSLNEVRNVNAYTVYIEVGFHDNATEAAWLIGHTEDIAEAICKGICENLGMEYIQPPVEVNKGQKLYRVQIGAFAIRENAERLLKTVKVDFPDAFIQEVEL